MLCYATTFHPDLSFLLMERRSSTLQQMFNDAQEVEYNLQDHGKISEQIRNEELVDVEHESDHEQKVIDLNFEQRVNKIMHFLEVFNVGIFAKDNEQFSDPQVVVPKHFAADLNFKSFHHEQNADFAMNFFEIFSEECYESELENQLAGEKVAVPMFLIDEIAYVFYVPKYDEYDNDYAFTYDANFLEQPDACSLLENDHSQQFKEIS
jgi:hypothetical protein